MTTKNASLKKDNSDEKKIEVAVMAMVQATVDAGKERAVFNINELFHSLKFSRLYRRDFPDAVCDVPTWPEFHRVFGNWMIGEYGDNIYVIFKLGGKGLSWMNGDQYHNVDISTLPKTLPAKPQPLRINLPEGVDPVEALAKINAMIAELPRDVTVVEPPAPVAPAQKRSRPRKRTVNISVSIPAAPQGPLN